MTAVAIVGLGLIGGSLALALRERDRSARIVAVDRDDVLVEGRKRCAGIEGVRSDDRDAVKQAMGDVDLVVFATPVSVICEGLGDALEVAKLVTDCGSTKRAVLRAAGSSSRRGRFVGGHPMAGAPDGGLSNARADLFVDRPWILCSEGSDDDAAGQVTRLVETLGARVVPMSAVQHDKAVAVTSHVPQILGSALAVLSNRQGARAAEGPAFERMTLGAGGASSMWADIFATNGDEVAAVLRLLIEQLADAGCGLEAEPLDVARVTALLAEARKLR